MSVLPFLAELYAQDIHVRADGARLRCNAPAGMLTPALVEQLQRRKDEIMEFLRSTEALTHRHRAIVPLQPRGTGMPIRDVRRYAALVRDGDGNEEERLELLRAHRLQVLAQLAEVQEHLGAIDAKIGIYEDKLSSRLDLERARTA